MLFAFFAPTPAAAKQRLICASTTSTQNSGLFDWLLPKFEKATGIEVHVIAVGTGAALEYGKRGDADVVLVHAKELELEMVKQGYFVERRDVMYNDFVIIGPLDDPAGIRGTETATTAFKKIAWGLAPFVSRGDNSGTHRKELALWARAGVRPHDMAAYMETGQGMASTQRVASEKGAYTLTDRGTWLARKDTLHLAVLFEGGPELINQYGAMAVNPTRHGHVKHREAMAFIRWLTSGESGEGQEAIGTFRTLKGERLFIPNHANSR